jgi:uncharacterized protein DUF4157
MRTHAAPTQTRTAPVTARQATRPQPAVRAILRAPVLQPKLKLGAVDDPAERDADRVADEVMRMPDAAVAATAVAPPGTVQRLCAECADEHDGALRRSPAAPGEHAEVPPIVHEVLRAPGQPLDAATRAFMEPRFGRDFGEVRIHYGPRADAAATSIKARAFTVGRDITFADRQYRPGTREGAKLLAHELAHTAASDEGLARRQVESGCPMVEPGAHPCPSEAPPPPEDFCQPFDKDKDKAKKLALADRDGDQTLGSVPYGGISKGEMVLGAIAAATRSAVAVKLYVKFIYGGSSTVEDASAAANDFTNSVTTKYVTRNLVNSYLLAICRNRNKWFNELSTGKTTEIDVPVISLQQEGVDSNDSIYALNYCGSVNVPGIIAGGVGKDQLALNVGKETGAAQNDSRGVTGDFRIIISRPKPSLLHFTVKPNLTYHVVDTVDFCPGNSGGWPAQRLTVPLSRWEASGISGDVTFKLSFAAPPMTGTISLDRVDNEVSAHGMFVFAGDKSIK